MMMQERKYALLTGIFLMLMLSHASGQENFFGHYFIATSFSNPAHAGDTRFAQFQIDERVQLTSTNDRITNTLVSYDQKLRNQRSGIGISIDQKSAAFKEYHARFNYSHTLLLFGKYWLKAGLGVSWHSISTHALSYTFPDQYTNYGLTGAPTAEPIDNEKASYVGASAGFAAYNEYTWLTLSVDNINRPGIEIIAEKYRAPFQLSASWGLLIPFNKNNRPRRLFAANGGLEPYSSIGPIAGFYKSGPFHVISFGVNAFTKPVFWGINFRYHAIYDRYLADGAASLNFLAGYRIESLCLAYSYDYMLNRTPTNYKGAHEVSLIYYLFSVKEDYKKNKLFPFPNQLMY